MTHQYVSPNNEMPMKKAIGLALLLMAGALTVSAQKTVISNSKTSRVVLDTPEQLPEFPGGYAELIKFLSENIRYPEDAQKKKVEGRVVVQFVVDEEGHIINPTVVRKVYPSLDTEALRIIALMPKWTPGRDHGQTVCANFVVPIVFRLN